MTKIEPILGDVLRKLVRRLESFERTGVPVRLGHAFSAFSGDVIGRICCEEKEEFLDDPDFAPQWYTYILERNHCQLIRF